MSDWLEAECERNRSTRQRICDQILRAHLKPGDRVLDIGCGPGFLTKAVAGHVKRIYGCDISLGALECARVINGAPNIDYLYSGESGFDRIEDGSLDVTYSFAVIQHLRETVIRSLMGTASRKLRPGGVCILQVQLDDDQWKKESEWAQDTSVTGRLKLKYALNFFPRSEAFFRQMGSELGLLLVAVQQLSELMDQPFDDIYHQHLIIFSKP